MASVKPWITGNDTGGIGAAVAASYAGEDNMTQLTVNILSLRGGGGGTTSASVATEAFDEPLTMQQVLAIVKPFIK